MSDDKAALLAQFRKEMAALGAPVADHITDADLELAIPQMPAQLCKQLGITTQEIDDAIVEASRHLAELLPSMKNFMENSDRSKDD